MLRRYGISVRLNLLVAGFSIALVGLVGVGYNAIHSGIATQQQLVALGDVEAAAQTSQYDFADFNGWQTAYAFDVSRLGASAAADTADSRKQFLASVARTRQNLTMLKKLSAVLSVDCASASSC